MTMNPKPGALPCSWDGLTPANGAAILVIDLYLRRQDVVDRIDHLADSDIQGAANGRNLSKLDLAKLYVELGDHDEDPDIVVQGRTKGDVLRLLADEIGFFASHDQEEIVKEQTIQVLLFLQTGATAPRMPSLPHNAGVDLDLKRQYEQPGFPTAKARTIAD